MKQDITTYLTIKQAAEQTGKDPTAIRYLIKKGRLQTERVGWTILIHRNELRKLTSDAGQG